MYREEDCLLLSGLQHFAFCPRQWALIHIEDQWAENLRTVEGELFHERAHDETFSERRGDLLTVRGLKISSPSLGVSGTCDVVEFHLDPAGIALALHDGRWSPVPIEYKRGRPKPHEADELQLCGQAMCLEEMLCCRIPQGFLFYGETRRRQAVIFTDALRSGVRAALSEMHRYAARGHTPKVKTSKACGACSLKDLCLPKLLHRKTVSDYLTDHMQEEAAP